MVGSAKYVLSMIKGKIQNKLINILFTEGKIINLRSYVIQFSNSTKNQDIQRVIQNFLKSITQELEVDIEEKNKYLINIYLKK